MSRDFFIHYISILVKRTAKEREIKGMLNKDNGY